jgi:type IV secretion system protein VirB10
MLNQGYCSRTVSALTVFQILPRTKAKQIVTVVATLLVALTCVALTCVAQDPPQTASQAAPTNSAAVSAPKPDVVTIPASTRFALVLTNPVSSKTMHRGDEVYAQTTAPVIVGDRAVIPPGIFVQGKIEKLTRSGSHAEMLMSSASLVFPNGYVANIAGPLKVESDEGTAWRDPSGTARAGAIVAPLAGAGLGALIGSSLHTTQSSTLGGTTITSSTSKGIGIGSVVGGMAGVMVSIAILLNSRHFFVDVGSPMEMTLPQPLTLSESQVADAIRQAREHPAAVPMPAPRPLPVPLADHGICYTPGTPGTPPTVIPGSPPIGDSPGTPDIVIPGTPAIPGTPYPCP